MAVDIYLRDYEGEWGEFNCIGFGNNSSGYVLPIIDKAIADGEKEINVYLNTGGGSVFCSLGITNGLKRFKESGGKVTTINEGICASAGTQIFMEGDDRIVYNSLFMIHKPSQFLFGDWTDEELKREAQALKIVQDTILLTYRPTGLDDDSLNAMLNAETWLTPAMCLDLGFATENRSSPDKKADVLAPAVEKAAKSSPANRVFANKFFNTIELKNSNMEDVKETLKQSSEAIKENTSVMNSIKKFFDNLIPTKNEGEEPTNASSDLADGGKIYYMGVLGVGTEVFTDEAMEIHPTAGDHDLADGNFITVDDAGLVTVLEKKDVEETENVEELKNEIQTLKDQLAQVSNSLVEATNSLNASNEALTKIKNVKSNFVPDSSREQQTDRNNNSATTELTFSQIKENKQNRKNKNTK